MSAQRSTGFNTREGSVLLAARILPPSVTFNGLREGDRCTNGDRVGTVRRVGVEPYRRVFGIGIAWDGGDDLPQWIDWNESGSDRIRAEV